jgi:D-xylose transport system ATP-binding protein
VTVFRDGRSVGDAEIEDITRDELVHMMVGREISEMYPPENSLPHDSETLFEIRDFNVYEYITNKHVVKNASITVKKGEILGVYGLVGAGRTEFISTAYGSDHYKGSGQVFWKGRPLRVKSPVDCLNAGIAYCTENRKEHGIIPTMDVCDNITIEFLNMFAKFFSIDKNLEVKKSEEQVKAFKIRTASLSSAIVNLSGGNQQKVLLARNLIGDIELLILDEPTRGIDIGAKQEIYFIMRELIGKGVTIVMISSELPEVLGMSDRVCVMHRGRVMGEFDNRTKKLTQENVMGKATGIEMGENS